MDKREALAHHLKVKLKLPPDRPTDEELDRIVAEIDLIAQFRVPTEEEWREITLRIVTFTGRYLYEGLDFSDFNVLLSQLKNT